MRRVSSRCSDLLILASLAALLPQAAQAQVNRCIRPDGRVVYTDAACEAAGFSRDAASSRRLSGVVVEHYDVRGHDGPALLEDLARRGPQGFHGMTNWHFDYRYRYAPQGGGCRVTSVSTSVRGRILMPRWVDAHRATPALRATWARYQSALMAHEEGHIATGESLTRALKTDLGAMQAATCEHLRAQVDAAAQILIDEHLARDRAYDARTRHGATQGAYLNLP